MHIDKVGAFSTAYAVDYIPASGSTAFVPGSHAPGASIGVRASAGAVSPGDLVVFFSNLQHFGVASTKAQLRVFTYVTLDTAGAPLRSQSLHTTPGVRNFSLEKTVLAPAVGGERAMRSACACHPVGAAARLAGKKRARGGDDV